MDQIIPQPTSKHSFEEFGCHGIKDIKLHPLFCDVLAVHYDQISGTRDRWQPAAALEEPIASLAMSPLSK